jgi:cbb3-type cytochrome oxidase subunit 3
LFRAKQNKQGGYTLKWLTLVFLAAILITSVSAEVCTEDIYEICNDGRRVNTLVCINGILVDTFKFCPDVINQTVCDQDIEFVCWDGSIITTNFCVDSVPRPTGITCPVQGLAKPNMEGETKETLNAFPSYNNNLTVAIVIVFCMIVYVYFLRKKKQKEYEQSNSQVEDQDQPDIRGESGPDPLPPPRPPSPPDGPSD